MLIQQTVTEAPPHPRRWWAMMAAALTIFMAALDMNILNVALPTIAAEFGASQVAWVSLSYTLSGVAAITIAGRLSDQFGQKKVMLWGLLLFLLGSVLCGMAESLAQLIVYRVIQGIGGACITAPIMAIATVLFPGSERGKAMAMVGIIGPLGGIAGPGLGGFLTEMWGWSAIFYINVPVGLISFVLLWELLPEDTHLNKVKFDVPGTAAMTSGALLLILGLSLGRAVLSVVIALSGIVLLIVFYLIEKRATSPILPPALIRTSGFALPIIGIVTSSMIGSGLGFVTAFFLQRNMGLSASQTGLVVLVTPLCMIAAARLSGVVTDRISPRAAAAAGAALGIIGLALLAPLDPSWTMGDFMLRSVFIGLGQGLFASPANVSVMAATPREYLGVSSAVGNLVRQLGFALGPAVAAFIWTPDDGGSLAAMHHVLYLFIAAQLITIATTFRFTKHSR